jgi:hypothetical protein
MKCTYVHDLSVSMTYVFLNWTTWKMENPAISNLELELNLKNSKILHIDSHSRDINAFLLWNEQPQRQRCSMLERLFKVEETIFCFQNMLGYSYCCKFLQG